MGKALAQKVFLRHPPLSAHLENRTGTDTLPSSLHTHTFPRSIFTLLFPITRFVLLPAHVTFVLRLDVTVTLSTCGWFVWVCHTVPTFPSGHVQIYIWWLRYVDCLYVVTFVVWLLPLPSHRSGSCRLLRCVLRLLFTLPFTAFHVTTFDFAVVLLRFFIFLFVYVVVAVTFSLLRCCYFTYVCCTLRLFDLLLFTLYHYLSPPRFPLITLRLRSLHFAFCLPLPPSPLGVALHFAVHFVCILLFGGCCWWVFIHVCQGKEGTSKH